MCELLILPLPKTGQSSAFCGRSGKQLKKHHSSQRGMLIDEWSRAVKSLNVSSSIHQASRLIDCSDQCWQSSGSQGKVRHWLDSCNVKDDSTLNVIASPDSSFHAPLQHWIRLELFPDVLVHRLKMTVDPADSSYMPSLVVVSGKITLFIQFTIMHILQFFLPFMFLLFKLYMSKQSRSIHLIFT